MYTPPLPRLRPVIRQSANLICVGNPRPGRRTNYYKVSSSVVRAISTKVALKGEECIRNKFRNQSSPPSSTSRWGHFQKPLFTVVTNNETLIIRVFYPYLVRIVLLGQWLSVLRKLMKIYLSCWGEERECIRKRNFTSSIVSRFRC